jgi:hypothetical protein
MRKMLIALGAAGLAMTVSACADYGYGPHRGGPEAMAYDGYYDDFYGPFYDGYWGDDGAFWYTLGEGRPFVRDEHGHFRHDGPQGFHGVTARNTSHEGAPHYAGGGRRPG